MEQKYDSSKDTLLHIKRVQELLNNFAIELIRRGNIHDASKLDSIEKEIFDAFTPQLAKSTYGSEEYREMLKLMGPGLLHHYKNNSHHPEHYEKGVDDFDLFDLVEMYVDWKAASERHKDGNIFTSLHVNKKRFNISDQLFNIFYNTSVRLNHEPPLQTKL